MPSDPAVTGKPIKLCVAALGGQGGGVLATWLIQVAEAEGYLAQSTSVPGVAQRTGATIYYLEFFPRALAEKAGREPIMALMPVPGDVDCVVASELVEAGRAIQRGLVTPERTTLISSTHRSYTITERSSMGDGTVDSAELTDIVRNQSRRVILFDMDAVAERNHSVISSVMFGALCGAGVLPFKRETFESVIRASKIAVESNLAAFKDASDSASAVAASAVASGAGDAVGSGVERIAGVGPAATGAAEADPLRPSSSGDSVPNVTSGASATLGIGASGAFPVHQAEPSASNGQLGANAQPIAPAANASRAPEVQALLARVAKFDASVQSIIREGTRRTVDYQDPAYAALYLQRMEHVASLDARYGEGQGRALTEAVARGLALWMTFEDTIRVADLKTRATRFTRVRDEIRADPGQLFGITEFMKPRVTEIAGTMPAGLGRRVLASQGLSRWLSRFTKGKQIRTSTISGFLLLNTLAGLRRWRRGTLRFHEENERIEHWLKKIESLVTTHYALAVELARAQRLVKGYGDTHERGLRNFAALVDRLDAIAARPDGAAVFARLQAAALADEEGHALARELATVERRT